MGLYNAKWVSCEFEDRKWWAAVKSFFANLLA
jgi:hypothetical protein